MSESRRGTAIRVLSFGVIVRLPDGREGFLPRREFTASSVRDLRQLVQVGQEFNVVITDESRIGRALLKVVLSDNWDTLDAGLESGAVMTGVVRGVEHYGAFVDVVPGVTGLVRRDELQDRPSATVEQLLWPGDAVQVVVRDVVRGEERVSLSMSDAASIRSRALAKGEPLPSHQSRDSADPPTFGIPESPWLLSLNVLIVDDEPDIAEHLTDRLQKWGHVAEWSISAEDAERRMGEKVYDLVVMDIGLPGKDGLQAARDILGSKQRAKLVLMTDWSRATSVQSELQQMQERGIEIIIKPNHEVELSQVLTKLFSAEPSFPRRRVPAGFSRPGGYLSQVGMQESIARILASLRQQVGAQEALLFVVDPLTRALNLIAREGGHQSIKLRELQTHWTYSPVRDVIQDQQIVFASDADNESSARFKYLRRTMSFRSCIGVPVPATTMAGLFVFHAENGRFTRTHRRLTTASAERIAAVLDRQAIERALVEVHRYILLGQLGAVVVHEVNNKMGAVGHYVKRLGDDLDLVRRVYGNTQDGNETWDQLTENLEVVRTMAAGLVQLTTGFDTLVRHQDAGSVDVQRLLTQAISIVKPMAARHKVSIYTRYASDPFTVEGVAAWLEQGFANLLLNSIQQIEESRSGIGGNVLITTSARLSERGRFVQVRFYDDGPGIHTSHWERIFDLGFTTRENGSGLGLFVTRRLLEAMGGQIRVEESFRLCGTTFLVELPVL